MSSSISHLYEFGTFRLNPSQRLLLRNSAPVSITPKAFDLLVVLVEQSGKLLDRDTLLETIWPGVSVEEGNLSVTISHLRKVLGDDRGKQEYIETVSKGGYRFVAPVAERCDTPSDSAAIPVDSVQSPGHEDLAERNHHVNLAQHHELPEVIAPAKNAPVWQFLIVAGLVLATLLLASRSIAVKRANLSANNAGPIKSLAVLPFETIGVKNDDEYLGLGTADALITRLANTGKILVRPTSAIEKYRHTSLSPQAAGKEQAVDAVLDGRIQREASRVRLTVQMVRVRDGAQLWAGTFDEESTNIFTLEDEVSERIAHSIRLHFTDKEEKRFNQRPTGNTEAYDAFLKGRYFWNKRTGEGFMKGLQYFREAIRLDPNFAQAYGGVADCYATLGLYAILSPQEAFPAAREAARKALAMDDSLAGPHAVLGLIDLYYDWNGQEAQNEFRSALDADPNDVMAHSWGGENLAAMGRFPEAVAEAKLALDEDPLSLIVNTNAGWTFYLAGHYEEAIELLKKAIDIDPAFPRTHFRLGEVYEERGLYDQAVVELKQAVKLSGGDIYYEAALGHAYAASGRSSAAHQVLHTLAKQSKHQYIPGFAIALVYAGLNENDTAFEWLDKASNDHSTSMAYLKVDPALSGLRSDARFANVARRVNF
ncbi:MAG TPA: tetratricopeptide repeat protein [Acidobacteriaceae bacterium]|jgi:DNA-binding winged helix-turn-helix (wHTH) protein/TolB-like protein/Flp pilus assembly protein TadD|nr:tetratricopeptide repeat protein [Acidobacteriaceae bacterium]